MSLVETAPGADMIASKLPTIAIVGRPNVGKSSLFNRLARSRIAIVHDEPGITRDRISTQVYFGEHSFEIIDTGGIGSVADADFAEQVLFEAEIAMAAADLILLVVDTHEGLVPTDHALAELLRKKTSAPVLLVANKADTVAYEAVVHDFHPLGFEEILPVSAEHNRGVRALRTAILRHFPNQGNNESTLSNAGSDSTTPLTTAPLHLAIVGRPNVGKSSLVNALLDTPRTIISDVAGTTRDAVDIPCKIDGKDYTLIDTAGIRRQSQRRSAVETFSMHRTQRAIERSDITLLVLDASEPITRTDRQIARLILSHRKPCLVLLNKYDLYHPTAARKDRVSALSEDAKREIFFLDYAPQVVTSAKKKQHIGRILSAVEQIKEAANTLPSTSRLNQLLHDSFEHNPPPQHKAGRRARLFYSTWAPASHYGTQRDGATRKRQSKSRIPLTPPSVPVPKLILFLNKKGLLPDSYLRYLENTLRKNLAPLPGLPLLVETRGRVNRYAEK